MASIEQISIDRSNVFLVNKGTMSNVTVVIDLSSVWNKLIKYTNVYVKTELTIPIIENTLAQNMVIGLEDSYRISTIDEHNPQVIISGQVPGVVDVSRIDTAKGIAGVMGYNVIDTN